MHELSIVLQMFELLESIAKEQDLKRIDKVYVKIGELSDILPDYLTECWNVARDGDLLKSSTLVITTVTATARCSCTQEFEMIKNNRKCPRCGKSDYKILSGKEFDIEQIEAV